MTRRIPFGLFAFTLELIVAIASVVVVTAAPPRPNVVIVMTDDQGYGDFACHGNPHVKTPHLDKLHSESTRFADFHVNPFCAPTRAALLTGRMADLTGVRATIHSRNHLPADEVTMAEYFRNSGYATGLFGKWHLGRNYPYRPIDRGFETWIGHGDGGCGTSSDYWNNDKMNDHYMRNGKWEKFEGWSGDVFFDEAMDYVSKSKEKPFFVYLATHAPHWPWNIPKEWRKPYETEKLLKIDKRRKRSIIDFYATVTRLDYNVGRFRKHLEDEGLAENTIFIFMTDNGTAGSWGVYYGGMRGIKGTAYDGGHRVPCFLHWPAGKQNVGRDVDQLTAHVDLLPSLVDLCSLKKPKRANKPLSGISLAPMLRGEAPSADFDQRSLFVHCQNSEVYEKWRNAAVISKRWRLVNRDELYEIAKDPKQSRNVASEFPEVLSSMRGQYDAFWEEIGGGKTPMPRPVVGSGKTDCTWLVCDAWFHTGGEKGIWNQPYVNEGKMSFGKWPIRVSRKGSYRFEVARWPKEADGPIAGVPANIAPADVYLKEKPVTLADPKAFPITRVRLRVGDQVSEQAVGAADNVAAVTLQMDSGDFDVEARFLDAEGNEYPAYYVYVYE